jgi:hypothetical protein
MAMTDEEIFDLADQYGWMDDFGRWNFQPDRLVSFALAIKTAEWVGLTAEELLEKSIRSERELIAQSMDKQADLAADEIDRQWAQEMAAAIRARGMKQGGA